MIISFLDVTVLKPVPWIVMFAPGLAAAGKTEFMTTGPLGISLVKVNGRVLLTPCAVATVTLTEPKDTPDGTATRRLFKSEPRTRA
jgi:hypothetical protein